MHIIEDILPTEAAGIETAGNTYSRLFTPSTKDETTRDNGLGVKNGGTHKFRLLVT